MYDIPSTVVDDPFSWFWEEPLPAVDGSVSLILGSVSAMVTCHEATWIYPVVTAALVVLDSARCLLGSVCCELVRMVFHAMGTQHSGNESRPLLRRVADVYELAFCCLAHQVYMQGQCYQIPHIARLVRVSNQGVDKLKRAHDRLQVASSLIVIP